MEDLGPLRQLPREHVLLRDRRGRGQDRRVRHQADELPRATSSSTTRTCARYRDLPLRWFEFGTVYRHELSGVVHGLMRARGFTQDDAHIFCTPEQVVPEVQAMLDIVDWAMNTFGFEYTAEVSTRPEKSIGTDEQWEHRDRLAVPGARRARAALRDQPGRRRVLRPEDRHQAQGRHRPDVAVRDHPGRLQQPRALRHDVPHGREHRGAAGHAAPHHPRLDGAVLRHPHRALRRRVPDVARAGAGRRHPDRRPAHARTSRASRSGSRPRGVRCEVVRRAGADARQDRQGAGAEGAVHARRRRQGSRVRRRVRARAAARATSAR